MTDGAPKQPRGAADEGHHRGAAQRQARQAHAERGSLAECRRPLLHAHAAGVPAHHHRDAAALGEGDELAQMAGFDTADRAAAQPPVGQRDERAAPVDGDLCGDDARGRVGAEDVQRARIGQRRSAFGGGEGTERSGHTRRATEAARDQRAGGVVDPREGRAAGMADFVSSRPRRAMPRRAAAIAPPNRLRLTRRSRCGPQAHSEESDAGCSRSVPRAEPKDL
jgi:hypothetical protein